MLRCICFRLLLQQISTNLLSYSSEVQNGLTGLKSSADRLYSPWNPKGESVPGPFQSREAATFLGLWPQSSVSKASIGLSPSHAAFLLLLASNLPSTFKDP